MPNPPKIPAPINILFLAAALLLCAPTRVESLIVEGRVVVENHELTTLALAPILARHRRFAAKMVGSQPLL